MPALFVAMMGLVLIFGSGAAGARSTEIEASRLVGFDQPLGHSVRVYASIGYCAGEPQPQIDHVKVVEHGVSSQWPRGYAEVTVFLARELAGEPEPTCAPLGGTLPRRIKLRRPTAGLPILDGSRHPAQRIRLLR